MDTFLKHNNVSVCDPDLNGNPQTMFWASAMNKCLLARQKLSGLWIILSDGSTSSGENGC